MPVPDRFDPADAYELGDPKRADVDEVDYDLIRKQRIEQAIADGIDDI